jgi:hypothetical protein
VDFKTWTYEKEDVALDFLYLVISNGNMPSSSVYIDTHDRLPFFFIFQQYFIVYMQSVASYINPVIGIQVHYTPQLF